MSALKFASSGGENIRSSTRQRANVTFYDPITPKTKSAKDSTSSLAAGKGNGIRISEMPYVIRHLNRYTAEDDVVVSLHRLLYGSAGKNTLRKKNIRLFQGYVFHAKGLTKEKVVTRLNDRKVLFLRELCDMFGIEKNADKGVIVDRLVTYLSKPVITNKQENDTSNTRNNGKLSSVGKKHNASTSSASKNSKSKAHDDNEKPKRPLTAFFLFSKDMRPDIKKRHPDFKVTDIARELGKQWKSLSAAKKQPYVAHAEQLKVKYTKEVIKSQDKAGKGSLKSKTKRKASLDETETKKKASPTKKIKSTASKKSTQASEDDETQERSEEEE